MDVGAPHSNNPARPASTTATASVCVLASGSGGNCTVLAYWACGQRRLCLIDAGLSPRKTAARLEELGLSIDALDAILLTHLDWDHFHRGWARRLPRGAKIHLHERHSHTARRQGPAAIGPLLAPFDGSFELSAGVRVRSCLASHDDLGSVAYRLEFAACGACLGFATDLGRVTDLVVEHLREVDVLAIESNYCPRLQESSSRPWFLKRRITGGHGHLSNEQAVRAIEEIAPRSHVIFLHLSEECNDPELVASMHAGADYAFTITEQERPTRWVEVAAPRGLAVRTTAMSQFPLFMTPRDPPASPAAVAPPSV